jgi:hypothetical protein
MRDRAARVRRVWRSFACADYYANVDGSPDGGLLGSVLRRPRPAPILGVALGLLVLGIVLAQG